jgi:WS/DGAT/MGAT family acyltransferase
MWRCEQDPMLRPALVMVLLLDRPPDPGRFAAGHEWATRMIPRLRERPVAPLLAPTLPVWTPDPEFDVSRHLRHAGLPAPAGPRQLFDLARDLAAAPFDLRRPVWESVLVEDLHWEPEPYRAAWLVRFHHCLADGPLIAFWLGALLNRAREPRTGKPRPPAPARRLETLPEQLIGPLPGVHDAAPAALRMARAATAVLRRPVSTAVGVGTGGRRLLDVLTRPAGKPSPLLRARGTSRRFEGLVVDLDGLRSAARNAETSVDAAYCAALLAGLRHYHAAHGVTAANVSAAMTMPLPRSGPPSGNRFNGVKFPGALDVADPRALCRTVDAVLARSRAPFPPATLDLVLTCVNQAPDVVLSRVARSLGRSHDLQVSHVVALARSAYVSGARIGQAWCFGPAPGCAVMALMVSQPHLATLALTLDAAAVPDPAKFRACVETGFADVIGSLRVNRAVIPLEMRPAVW